MYDKVWHLIHIFLGGNYCIAFFKNKWVFYIIHALWHFTNVSIYLSMKYCCSGVNAIGVTSAIARGSSNFPARALAIRASKSSIGSLTFWDGGSTTACWGGIFKIKGGIGIGIWMVVGNVVVTFGSGHSNIVIVGSWGDCASSLRNTLALDLLGLQPMPLPIFHFCWSPCCHVMFWNHAIGKFKLASRQQLLCKP